MLSIIKQCFYSITNISTSVFLVFMNFCPSCGKKTESGFCDSCKPKEVLKIKNIHIKVCVSCRKYLHKNKWDKYSNLEQTLKKIVKQKANNLTVQSVLPNFGNKPGLQIPFNIEIIKNNESYVVPAKLELTYCDNCSKNQGNYYEGDLQLRNPTKEITDFITTFMKDNALSFTEESTKNGSNLRFTNKKKLYKLGKELLKKFGGQLKTSARLYSKDRLTSKELHRVNVYYSPPDYVVGDVVKTKTKLIHVTSLNKGINLKTGKKTSIDNNYKILKPVKTTVSKLYPNLEIINPLTYQSTPVQYNKKLKIGEKVKVVNDDGLFYVL